MSVEVSALAEESARQYVIRTSKNGRIWTTTEPLTLDEARRQLARSRQIDGYNDHLCRLRYDHVEFPGQSVGSGAGAGAGMVPTSLRTAFATYDLDPGNAAMHRHCERLSYEFVRKLLSAPDSTRTGQGEAEKLVRLLAAVSDRLRDNPPNGLVEGDLYVAAKNEGAGSGWRYVPTGLTVGDLDEARAILAARPAAPEAQGAKITADVLTMRLGDGQADYFVRLKCGERWVTPHVFKDRYKAEYEAAYYAWMFGLRAEQPDLMAYDEASHPNEPAPPASSGQGGR